MTLDDLAAKLDAQGAKLDALDTKVDLGFNDSKTRDEHLKRQMDQGFNEARIRDERLEGLTTFGLEARDVLRDEMHRRFDTADRKNDEQITLLKDAVQHRS